MPPLRVWKAVWSINIPLKVRKLLWRACSNILPTWDNLWQKKKKWSLSVLCVANKEKLFAIFCGISLLLIMCRPWLEERFKKAMPMSQIFSLLTRSMLEWLPIEEMELWAVLSWAIWNARNKIYFEDNQARLDHYEKNCYLR